MADWLAAKHPQPTARMYDLRPSLPAQRAGLAQRRMASLATEAEASSETEQPFSLTEEEIAELAAILDERMRERRMAGAGA
ncbi:hypothetical protein [Dokdonella ginsengisoli]|uniref:Uncharacterized protein n=1 Tax=Dokdonella ginsengisoli TaxID=363846 RepID=A0ABV9QUV2_9GAMM